MNCKTCGYRLWNLPPGSCPECGAAFKPSDFDFRRDAVQYLCPSCTQTYYGTDDVGHLVPPEFDCVTCGEHLHMDQMVVRPAHGVEEDLTPMDRNPWLDRKRVGFVKGWFATVGQGMVLPNRLIAATPPNGGVADALWFTLLTQVVYFAVGLFPLVVLMFVGSLAAGPAGAGVALVSMGTGIVIAVLATLIFFGLWALVTHGFLRVTGGTAHGFGRTLQCLGYSSGANCLSAVPCVGMYFFWVGWIWWAVSAIIMLVKGQAVGGLRATIGVLIVPVLVVAAFVGWVVWLMNTISNQVASLASPPTAYVQQFATAIAHTYAPAHQGLGPAHASELLLSQTWMSAYEFTLDDTITTLDDIPLPGGTATMDDFDQADSAEQARLAQAAAKAMPPNLVAHRVGDFVFTHHGFTVSPPADAALWIVIASPDPVANATWTPPAQSFGGPPTVTVGLASGTTLDIDETDFTNQLSQQNALRATHNLPPIPDPTTITHAQPAVAAEAFP